MREKREKQTGNKEPADQSQDTAPKSHCAFRDLTAQEHRRAAEVKEEIRQIAGPVPTIRRTG